MQVQTEALCLMIEEFDSAAYKMKHRRNAMARLNIDLTHLLNTPVTKLNNYLAKTLGILLLRANYKVYRGGLFYYVVKGDVGI